jgi:hypothetical protein
MANTMRRGGKGRDLPEVQMAKALEALMLGDNVVSTVTAVGG